MPVFVTIQSAEHGKQKFISIADYAYDNKKTYKK
jgi:hypothetical protein